jgi:hypothetical protein
MQKRSSFIIQRESVMEDQYKEACQWEYVYKFIVLAAEKRTEVIGDWN